MKIAVTYENGNVFQHFGRTEVFKIYEVENDQVVSASLLECDGVGHEALADLLADNDIDAVICGGIGEGAEEALMDAGISLCAGAEGDADKAVEDYLNDLLINTGANCDHHDEEHECAEAEEGCGGNCGTCGGGCGGCSGCGPKIEGPNVGKTVRTHYCGTFNDGTQFDSSYDRGEPLEFVCGSGMMIPGYDQAVANMTVGEIVNIHLMPEEAYGQINPAAIITVERAELPGSEELEIGQQVYLYNTMGQPVLVTVTAREGTTITFDANHQMAGKELNFKIELVEIL